MLFIVECILVDTRCSVSPRFLKFSQCMRVKLGGGVVFENTSYYFRFEIATWTTVSISTPGTWPCIFSNMFSQFVDISLLHSIRSIAKRRPNSVMDNFHLIIGCVARIIILRAI